MEERGKVKKLFLYFVYKKSDTKKRLIEGIMLDDLALTTDINEFWSAYCDMAMCLAKLRGYDTGDVLGTSSEFISESAAEEIMGVMDLENSFNFLFLPENESIYY